MHVEGHLPGLLNLLLLVGPEDTLVLALGQQALRDQPLAVAIGCPAVRCASP